jgi:hypothetical protein
MFTPRDEAWYRKMAPYSAALIVVFSLGMLVTVARTNLAVRIACLIGMILAMPAIGFVCFARPARSKFWWVLLWRLS